MKDKETWFGPRWKRFFGPIPQTWQGWLITSTLMALIIGEVFFEAMDGLVNRLFAIIF
ncbi:hypothetical protein [Lactococcus sp.]|uniref:hypothetical protein n=1 Tax=Lactococcus sp. TaxID=44273 RepID=UPI0035B311DC